jgi:hypothetical protein
MNSDSGARYPALSVRLGMPKVFPMNGSNDRIWLNGSVIGTMVRGTVWAIFSACLGSCVQKTVTDSNGQVIYQDMERARPFESEQHEMNRVMEKERDLGW